MSKVTIRLAKREDLDRLVAIEEVALPSSIYLREVQDEFYDPKQGELIVAEVDGVVAGFAHYSIQYDQAAWIETLRVDPPLQRHGAGDAIWDRIMEICDELSPPAIRMYTNVGNDGSIKLAYKRGLETRILCHEYELKLAGQSAPPSHDFEPVPYEEVESTLAPYVEGYHNLYFTNRTFYGLGDPLYKALARDDKVHRKDDAVIVVGSRYRHEIALHVGMFCGNIDHCIDFAIARGLATGVPKLVCLIPNDRMEMVDVLRRRGFTLNSNDIIMMDRIF